MRVGKRIAELRKKRGMTQEQLAEMLDTARQAVSKWESEKTNPDLDYVVSMGRIFGVSMDDLLLGKEAAPINSEAGNVNCHNKKSSAYKRNKITYLILLSAGILILLLCPLFATMYRNYVSEYGPALTDPYVYLQQWPLVGIKIAGIFLTITGALGFSWPALRKLYYKAINTWKET